jgi:hypothetical protein
LIKKCVSSKSIAKAENAYRHRVNVTRVTHSLLVSETRESGTGY